MHSVARVGLRHISHIAAQRSTHNSRGLAIRTMASAGNTYHILEYKYVPDILEKRGPYRAEHLEGANKMAEKNNLVMAGAVGNPVEGATFIFRNLSQEEIEAFVKKDPYVINGLVPSWSVKPYTVVAGDSS